MDADVRHSATWREVTDFFGAVHRPGRAAPSDLAGVAVRPGTGEIAATAVVQDTLDGPETRRVVRVRDGQLVPAGDGFRPGSLAGWSGDGRWVAQIVARPGSDTGEVRVIDEDGVAAARDLRFPGVVEDCCWSPAGHRLLVLVADPGADVAGAEGSGRHRTAAAQDTWLPVVQDATTAEPGRSLWLVDLDSGTQREVSAGYTVWEAGWAGPEHAVAVASMDAGESAWYSAGLVRIDLAAGVVREVYRGDHQLGVPAGSPDGRRVAVVEALCSDRGVVAGALLLVGDDGTAERVPTDAVDVTSVQWIDGERLGYAGVRGLHSVVAVRDLAAARTRELWATSDALGLRHRPHVRIGDDEQVVTVSQAYRTPPGVVRHADGATTVLASTADAVTDGLGSRIGRASGLSWTARDGERIEGILIEPDRPGPHPLVVYLHGGPVWSFRDRWLGGYPVIAMLAARGYALLLPNPRGSSGRGHAFVEAVVGDVGGVDAGDVLDGVDDLVGTGVADGDRIGVTGGSYGGYLSAWLVTQDQRFRAAVPVAPATHWRTLHHSTNIRAFDEAILRSDPLSYGVYDTRSPLTHAALARTPCLNIAGALDRCTPPAEAEQFHRALRERGVDSALVVYPTEGHGVRSFPGLVDYCVRMVDWFERYMPPDGAARPETVHVVAGDAAAGDGTA